MEIAAETTIKDLRTFLKVEFALDVRFTRGNRLVSDSEKILEASAKKKAQPKKARSGVEFAVDSTTVVSDLERFVHEATGIVLEIRNRHGLKISGRRTLEEGKDFTALPTSSSRTMDSNIQAALNVARNADYSDADWVRRIFEKAAFKADSTADRRALIEAAIEIGEENSNIPGQEILVLLGFACKDKADFVEAHAMAQASDNPGVNSLASKVREMAIERIGLEENGDFL